MKKRIPTFRQGEKLLTGASAREEWKTQTARCGCGSHGDEKNSISGSSNDMPAEWLGCDNCTGRALGRPLVYRLPSQLTT